MKEKKKKTKSEIIGRLLRQMKTKKASGANQSLEYHRNVKCAHSQTSLSLCMIVA